MMGFSTAMGDGEESEDKKPRQPKKIESMKVDQNVAREFQA